jgi:hypothetical protein
MPCVTPRNMFIFTATSGPSPNPQAGGPRFLAEYTNTNHISGRRLHPQHGGRVKPLWQEPSLKLVWQQQITEHAPCCPQRALSHALRHSCRTNYLRHGSATLATGLAYTTLLRCQPSPCPEPGDRVGAPTTVAVSFRVSFDTVLTAVLKWGNNFTHILYIYRGSERN